MPLRRRDRILQSLARSIAETVEVLGADGTARILGSIALDLAGEHAEEGLLAIGDERS